MDNIVNTKLMILKTEEDKSGTDILMMSNFLNNYLISSMSIENSVNKSDYSIINDKKIFPIVIDVINNDIKRLKNGITLMPDFESLPDNVKYKLKKGIYKIGESKQVDGNYRPVIIDENNVRVKDITLKIGKLQENFHADIINFAILVQLKEIKNKIKSVRELIEYQIERDRVETIFTPFINARDKVLQAQNENDISTQRIYLNEAINYLIQGRNNTIGELKTNRDFLIKSSSNQENINMYINHIIEDICILNSYTGIMMHIYDYLGCKFNVKNTYDIYKKFMLDFSNDRNNKAKMSGFELMHDNYKYNKDNLDFWYDYSMNIKQKLDNNKLNCNEYILIGVED